MIDKSNSPVIRAESLRKSFRSGDGTIRVLEGLDIAVYPAETISVRGESGSGKTTLLNLLAGLEVPDAGSVFWGVTAIPKTGLSKLGERRAGHLGIIFQSYHLLNELNVLENVLLAARVKGKVDAAVRERAENLLKQVGLGDRAKSSVNVLSGGERQRVAVARALVNQPKAILADEPTGNLDQKTGDAVMALLLEVCAAQQTALVLVTHNVEYARQAQKQLLLEEGKLIQGGS